MWCLPSDCEWCSTTALSAVQFNRRVGAVTNFGIASFIPKKHFLGFLNIPPSQKRTSWLSTAAVDGVVEESSSVIDRFGACCFGGLPKNITFDNLISAHTPARQIMFALLCKASTFTLFLYCGWVITVGPIHHGGQSIHGTLQPCMLLLHGAHLGLTRRLNHMMYANEPKIYIFFINSHFFFFSCRIFYFIF